MSDEKPDESMLLEILIGNQKVKVTFNEYQRWCVELVCFGRACFKVDEAGRAVYIPMSQVWSA